MRCSLYRSCDCTVSNCCASNQFLAGPREIHVKGNPRKLRKRCKSTFSASPGICIQSVFGRPRGNPHKLRKFCKSTFSVSPGARVVFTCSTLPDKLQGEVFSQASFHLPAHRGSAARAAVLQPRSCILQSEPVYTSLRGAVRQGQSATFVLFSVVRVRDLHRR